MGGELTADEKSQDMSLTAKRSPDSWSQNKNRDRLFATPVGPDVSRCLRVGWIYKYSGQEIQYGGTLAEVRYHYAPFVQFLSPQTNSSASKQIKNMR